MTHLKFSNSEVELEVFDNWNTLVIRDILRDQGVAAAINKLIAMKVGFTCRFV